MVSKNDNLQNEPAAKGVIVSVSTDNPGEDSYSCPNCGGREWEYGAEDVYCCVDCWEFFAVKEDATVKVKF